jgi:hypothetical protein
MWGKRVVVVLAAVAVALAVISGAGAWNHVHDHDYRFHRDPVPRWLATKCYGNGVSYISDEGIKTDGAESCDDPLDNPTTICVDGTTYLYVTEDPWSDAAFLVDHINSAVDESGETFGHSASIGACGYGTGGKKKGVQPQGPDRYIFCAVAGNTHPDGWPITPGVALNLPADQVLWDPHYKGATPAFWVPGVGPTCQLTPAQAALAAASTKRVNHTGGTGDPNQPEIYTYVG